MSLRYGSYPDKRGSETPDTRGIPVTQFLMFEESRCRNTQHWDANFGFSLYGDIGWLHCEKFPPSNGSCMIFCLF
ncbi:hypothetical protein F0562_011683 [Nyssa sinensis]|uniref:Uncharacterized protein n=1 Tax=Nyssa sinensis TaxID=561372 RepID=A0A5J4ZSK1_9ASTE|nr:hypothetical protein F0562_011683 [Nyssa sinensis]